MRVIFHIGYPRTGTTFLQKNFFEKNGNINYLGPKYYHESSKPFFSYEKMSLINKIDVKKDINIENVDFLFKDLSLSEDKVNLISSEKFLTYGINYFQNLIKMKKLLNLYNSRIKFKVFFVIRNQFDVLESQYHHAFSEISNNFSVKSFKELINLSDTEILNKQPEKTFFSNYFYDNTLSELLNYFERKDVGIFLYEELKNDKPAFLQKISNFLSIDWDEFEDLLKKEKVNQLDRNQNKIYVYSEYFTKLQKLYSIFYLKKILPQGIKSLIKKYFMKEIKADISNKEKRKIKFFFKKSNKIFEKISGLILPEEYF